MTTLFLLLFPPKIQKWVINTLITHFNSNGSAMHPLAKFRDEGNTTHALACFYLILHLRLFLLRCGGGGRYYAELALEQLELNRRDKGSLSLSTRMLNFILFYIIMFF